MRALFLDRDGVINIDSGYIWRHEDFIFNEGVFEACQKAQSMGFILVVVTNQAGIGRGLYSEEDFHALTDWMLGQFRENDIEIAQVYFRADPSRGRHRCVQAGLTRSEAWSRHAPQGPETFGIDMAASVIVGDRHTDIEAARNAGVGTKILVDGEEPDTSFSQPDAVVGSLAEAVDWLAARE